MRYRINVLSLAGKILIFTNVETYKSENGQIIFIDSKTKKTKSFPVQNCEIEEERE